jgi:hypothetical protein
MPATRSTLRRLAAAALFALACDDPYAPEASTNPIEARVVLAPFTGSQVNDQSGLFVTSMQATEVRESGAYDAVFDLAADGRVVIYPATSIALCTGCVLGIAPGDAAFEQMFIAPEQRSGRYRYNTPDTVGVNEPVYLVTKNINCVNSNIATIDVYAKIVVDSVKAAERRIYVHGVSDPNCGFRELKPGQLPQR